MLISLEFLEFSNFVRQLAEQKRVDAGFSGSWSDNGAHTLEDYLNCWQAGLRGEVPQVLSGYYESFKREQDPEYQEYLRLQKKFK